MMRRYFRVSAKEYLTEMQSWEADVLFEGLVNEFKAKS